MELIFFGVWALFIWWGATISNNKGRGYLLGAVLGIFGIIGVIVIALVPANQHAQWEREQAWRGEPVAAQQRASIAQGVPRCSNCKRQMPARATTCSACATPVSRLPVATAAHTPGSCSDCGEALTPGARFCASCGVAVHG